MKNCWEGRFGRDKAFDEKPPIQHTVRFLRLSTGRWGVKWRGAEGRGMQHAAVTLRAVRM